MYIDGLIERIIYELQKLFSLVGRWSGAVAQPDTEEFHSGGFDPSLFAGLTLLLQINNGLDSQRSQISDISLFRLGTPVVIFIDAAKILDLDVRKTIALRSVSCGKQ